METEVDSRRDARAGSDLSMVHVENFGFDTDLGMLLLQ